MKCLDSSGDGNISYREFQAFVRVFEAEEDREEQEFRQKQKEAARYLEQEKQNQKELIKQQRTKSSSQAAADAEEKKAKKKASASQNSDGLERLWAKIGKFVDKKGDGDGVAMFKSMFEKYDTNGDGELTMNELAEGLASAGITTSKKNFKLLLDELDKDGGGKISLKEWSKGAKKRL